jgi:hypothetical protein
MYLLYPLAGLVLLIGIPVYLHAITHFYIIVTLEHPEWIDRRGPVSFLFHNNMSRRTGSNTSMTVTRLAFSSRWRELKSTNAAKYVKRIRVLLPALLFVLFGVMVSIGAGAP